MEYQQQQQQQQFLHSSVIPRLTSTPAPKKPRPVSEATSISSSIVDYEYEANSRVSRAPVYNYSRYEDMDLAEDEYEEHSEDDEFDDLYSKTKRMNVWLTGDERNSVGSDGTKTASSVDEVATPTTPPVDYTKEMGMVDNRSIMGPRGPHLFRSLSASSAADFQPTNEELAQMSPIKIHPVSPKRSFPQDLGLQTSAAPLVNKHLQVDLKERPMSVISTALEDINVEEVENWSPAQVCAWMADLGFDESLIDKFRLNDISGAILMELQWEDLKELDIQSFGKKVELWSELNHLRKSPNPNQHSPSHDGSFEKSPKVGHTPPLLSRQASKRSRESTLSRSTSVHSSPTVRQSSQSMGSSAGGNGGLALQIPGNEGPQMVSPTKGRGLPLTKLTIPVEEPESEIEDSASEDYEDVSSAGSGNGNGSNSPNSFSMEPEVLHLGRNQSLRTRRRRSKLAITVPGSHINQPAGSAKSTGARSTCSKNSCTKGDRCGKHNHAPGQGFAASRLSKRKVRMSIASIPSTPLSPNPRMIEIFAAPSVAGSIIAGRRASMQVPESPRWAPSVCASSDVLGPRAKNDVQLKADELRKVAMVSAHEQVNKFLTLQHLQNLEERVQSPPGSSRGENFPDFVSPENVLSPRHIPLPLSPPADQQRAMSMAVNMGVSARPNIMRSQSVNAMQRPVPPPMNLSNAYVPPGQVTAGFVRPGTESDDMQPFASPRSFDQASHLTTNLTRSQTTKTAPQSLHSQLSRSQTVTTKSMKRAPSTKSSIKPPGGKAGAPSIASSKTSLSGGKSQMRTVNEDGDWEDDSAESSPPSPSDRVFGGEMKKRANNWLRHEWTTHRVELRGTKLTIYKSPSSKEVASTIDISDYNVICNNPTNSKFQNGMKALKGGSSQPKSKDSNGNYPFQLVPTSESKKSGQPGKEHHFSVASREERIDWMRELMLAKAIKEKKSGAQITINGKM